jgi:hypothetical protein
MFIPDLGSRILDPTTATKEEGEKKIFLPFFVATNIMKLEIILFLNMQRNFFFAKTLRIVVLFTQKLIIKL